MPVIHDIPLKLDVNEVLRQVGIANDAELRPKMESLIAELLAGDEADCLLAPAMAYELHAITEIQNDRLCLNNSWTIQGSLLSSALAQASDLAVVFCTIGPDLENEKAGCKAKKNLMRAFLLDGVGSAAIDILAVEAYHLIRDIAASRGYAASSPISPGMRGFSITEQWRMAKLAPIEAIGLQLTSSGMMNPQKSLSMIIGFGEEMPTWSRAEACARCNLAKSCRYRIHAQPL
jgi:hypothetical protein